MGSVPASTAATRAAIVLPDEVIEQVGQTGREPALPLHETRAEVDKLERHTRESVED